MITTVKLKIFMAQTNFQSVLCQGYALAAPARLRQLTLSPKQLKKYCGGPASCATFASMVNLAINCYIFIWLIYNHYWQKRYSFARHEVELFTVEDSEVTATFRFTWFHTNPNSNNNCNNSSCQFLNVINRTDIVKIGVEHRDFPRDDHCLI